MRPLPPCPVQSLRSSHCTYSWELLFESGSRLFHFSIAAGTVRISKRLLERQSWFGCDGESERPSYQSRRGRKVLRKSVGGRSAEAYRRAGGEPAPEHP